MTSRRPSKADVERLPGPAVGERLAEGLEALRKRTRQQLLEAAKALRLRRVSKLPKDQLARRVFEASQVGEDEADAAPVPGRQAARPPPPVAAAKLDLGPAAPIEERVEHIPWSYGVDRVTAAAVDPDALFVHWEVTDAAIERARTALGPRGPDAWLDLRVYDTSGIIFDGTNAHGYFDHRIERWERQWFFAIGKPSSMAVVEIGMKSSEGYFARMARSGRVDFPRKEPVSWSEPEWMRVAATGEAVRAGGPTGMPVLRGAPGGHTGAPPAVVETPARFAMIPLWTLREPAGGQQVRAWELLEGGWERLEWQQSGTGDGWFELQGRAEWEGPTFVTTWEAGPFTYPVQIEAPRREAWEGRSFAYTVGDVTRVVHGPWQVVIRNLGAHRSRTTLARWEIHRSWVAQGGRELRGAPAAPAALAGASERLGLGASGRMWIAASELRLGGASEFWRLGASELRLRGASERMLRGASERRLRGASERRLRGASERRLAGASERRLAGASERRLGGASERQLGGASERLSDGSPAPPTDLHDEGAYPADME